MVLEDINYCIKRLDEIDLIPDKDRMVESNLTAIRQTLEEMKEKNSISKNFETECIVTPGGP